MMNPERTSGDAGRRDHRWARRCRVILAVLVGGQFVLSLALTPRPWHETAPLLVFWMGLPFLLGWVVGFLGEASRDE